MPVTGKSVSKKDFAGYMRGLALELRPSEPLAVAVSGGGDSMALAFLLSEWAGEHGHPLTSLIVDHGLRPEAADEARFVASTLKPLGFSHKTLVWEGIKPKTRLQESARAARYALMAEYCSRQKIRHLFVAHHANDQAETILFRLAKGSGFDGLAGMQPTSHYEDGQLLICRPLLSVSHADLLATCRNHKMEWIEDPSNKNERYARVRLRNILDVIEGEGLSPARLSAISARIRRLVSAIDQLSENEYKNILIESNTKRIVISFSGLAHLADEVQIRILRKILNELAASSSQKVRLEEIERLQARIVSKTGFRAATLGGLIFRKTKEGLVVSKESDQPKK